MTESRVVKALVLFGSAVLGILLCYSLLELLRAIEEPEFGQLANVMLYGALLEEVLKFVFSLALFYKFKIYTIPLFVALGFGLGEQSLYFYSTGAITLKVIIMHTLTGAGMAYFFKKFLNSKQPKKLLYALGAAVLIHATYNILIWIWYITALQQLK